MITLSYDHFRFKIVLDDCEQSRLTKTRQFEAEKRVAIYKRMKIFISQLRVAANVSLASHADIED